MLPSIVEGENKYYIGENEETPIAEITFRRAGSDTLIIDHTYVSETLRGQGIARKLLDRVVEYARKEQKKIIPVCSYAVKVMVGNPEFEDVLK